MNNSCIFIAFFDAEDDIDFIADGLAIDTDDAGVHVATVLVFRLDGGDVFFQFFGIDAFGQVPDLPKVAVTDDYEFA